MTKEQLLAALETATGPDRELDEAIAACIAGASREVMPSGRVGYHKAGFWVSIEPILPYTSSIDAALTLVPENMDWRVGFSHDVLENECTGFARVRGPRFYDAATPAIALCIASLKART